MKNIFLNTIYSLSGKAIGMIALMILDVFIARCLSVDGYAEWAFYFSILTILFFVGWLGINTSSKVYLSYCRSNTERTACIKGAILLRMIASLIIDTIIIIIMLNLADILGYPEKYPDLKKLFLFSGILIFFNSFTEFYKELFMGLNWFKNLFILTTLEYLGYLFFSGVVLLNFSNVLAIVIGYGVSGTLVFIIGLYLIYREYHIFRRTENNLYNKYIRLIIKYAVPMMLTGIGVVVLLEIDTFMLGILSNKGELAVYNIAKNIDSKFVHVNYSLTAGAMTSFATINSENRIEKYRQFRKVGGVNFIITTFLALMIMIMAPYMIKLFYGEIYARTSRVIRFLVPYYILYSISTFYSTFLDFREKAKIRGIAYISVIVLDVGMNYILIPRSGALGAAIATSLSLIPYTLAVMIITVHEWKIIRKISIPETINKRI